MTAKDSITIRAEDWQLRVSRDMSLWHQWQANEGTFHHTKDFGVPAKLRSVSLTAHGTETRVLVEEKNAVAYDQAVRALAKNPRKMAALSVKYSTFGNTLLKALGACNKQLTLKTWQEFTKQYTRYAAGLWLTFTIGRNISPELQQKLRQLGFSEGLIADMLGRITYTHKHTPLFLSQIGLLRIGNKIQNERTPKSNATKELQRWLQEFQHVPVNFCGEPWTLADAKQQLAQVMKQDCAWALKQVQKNHQTKLKELKGLLKEIDNAEVTVLANSIAQATYLNEYRKNIFCKVSLDIRPVFQALAKRAKLKTWRECFYLLPEELGNIIAGKLTDARPLVKQRASVGLYITANGKQIILPAQTTKRLVVYVHALHGKSEKHKQSRSTSFTGIPANAGKVRGKVCVILSSKDFTKFKPGNILVAPYTSVDFVPIMEKAAAFVTNEGGLTSHAAIVAREMNKPAIVGSKVATQVLRDGDVVEVDASNGIVRKIK